MAQLNEIDWPLLQARNSWMDAIVRALCAFANDFENPGDGYIVIGQDWPVIDEVFTRSKPTERVPS